jgi:hypothetical protein
MPKEFFKDRPAAGRVPVTDLEPTSVEKVEYTLHGTYGVAPDPRHDGQVRLGYWKER